MIINSSTIAVVFPQIKKLRSQIGDFEFSLKDSFMPLSLLPVPDDAPDEMPRILAQTKFGHSTLNISPISMQLGTLYDESYRNDWGKCFEYISKRSNELREILKKTTGKELCYFGVLVECIIDDISKPASDFMIERFFKGIVNSPIYDLESKVTLVKDEAIYVNITFSNTRLYGDQVITATTPAMNLKFNEKVVARIDVNDRHSFNFKQDYISNESSMNNVLSNVNDIVTEKINKIISDGEYDI